MRGPVVDLAIESVFDEMVDTQRALHARPELAFAEHHTTALLRTRCFSLGLTERPRPCDTGGLFVLDGAKEGRTVVLRADIDGLPVHEATNHSTRSTLEGVMHACGHDFHVAALLGAARAMAAVQEDLPGRFVFLFQPAEEALGGARKMVEAGALVGLEDARFLSCHVASILPAGLIGVRAGTACAEATAIHITLAGAGGHGAIPSATGDVVRAVGGLLADLPHVVDGLAYEGQACVCSVGYVRAGTALNVAPTNARLEGTLRTFTKEQLEEAVGRLRALCERYAQIEQISVELDLPVNAPMVVNNQNVTDVLTQVAGEILGASQVLELPPVAPSDDVSEFLNRLEGCHFFVGGGRPDGTSGMHHSPSFLVDDKALQVAASVMANGALALATS